MIIKETFEYRNGYRHGVIDVLAEIEVILAEADALDLYGMLLDTLRRKDTFTAETLK